MLIERRIEGRVCKEAERRTEAAAETVIVRRAYQSRRGEANSLPDVQYLRVSISIT